MAGEYAGKLSNGGEFLTLSDAASDVIHQFRYNDADGWPERADGDGSSMELIDPGLDANLAASWRASSDFGGSPGEAGQEPIRDVVINEILSRTVAPTLDQIELYNGSTQAIDLAGWYLSDSRDYFKFRFPDQALPLGPGEYRVLDEQELGFGFKGSEADDAWLVAADDTGRPTQFVDHVEFNATQSEGVSFGRWINGNGPMVPMVTRTFGQTNSGPLAGDLNRDQQVNAADVDWLAAELREDLPDPTADLNADLLFNEADLDEMIDRILHTWFGDADLDGGFNSNDFVQVFQVGQYEDDVPMNSGWATGDWNGDGDFDSSDFVKAFQHGGYERGPQPAAALGFRLEDLALAAWLNDTWDVWKHRARQTTANAKEIIQPLASLPSTEG